MTTSAYSAPIPSRIPSSRSREVLALLVRRDLAVKYQDSKLGYLWSLLEPLGLALTYWFVFGILYNEHNPSAPLHVVVGIFAWMWTNSAINESTKSLVSQSTLITTIKAPRAIFPIGRVVARFAEYLAGLPIVVIFALFFDGRFDWHLSYLALAIVLQFLLLTGMSLALASINVIYRDVERMMRLLLRIMFYTAPIVYPLTKITGKHGHPSSLPHWAIRLYELNPFVGIFQLHHVAWESNEIISWRLVAVAAVGSIIAFFVGWWTFHKLEATVLKEL